MPVCGVDGKTYGNACAAGCANVKVDYEGECACPCTKIYSPVCGVDGVTYGNPCEAECANVEVDYNGECTPEVKVCSCEEIVDAMCGADGNTYMNPCQADCAGTVIAYKGPCGSQDKACEACAGVSGVWDPICLTSSSSKTYANPCYAKCKGGATDSSAFYKGVCKPECDAKCSQDTSGSVCCGKGTEFPNTCYATCVQGFNDPATECSSGLCTGDKAAALLTYECPLGGAVARCLRDPCDGTKCPGAPKAQCFSNYCTRFFRLEQLGLCAASWLDYSTGKLVKCNGV